MIRKGTPTSLNYNNLPPPILSLFAPRKPLDYLPPIEKNQLEQYSCISEYLDKFEEPTEEVVEHPLIEVRVIKEDRLKEEKLSEHKKLLQEKTKQWNPKEDEKIKGDPEKTIFVGRLVCFFLK
jgi:U1 small nuclear ribonucleoprotein 70kDa